MAKSKESEEIGPFTGFSKSTVSFFRELARHNNKPWFEAHHGDYDRHVLAPAKSFVVAMGERLKAIAPSLAAIPRVDKSIFRIHKDTRFSLDPSPYKTNLGIYFWEKDMLRRETTGFYVHLEPPELMLGGGMYVIPPTLLERFRRAAVAAKSGGELTKILDAVQARPGWEIGGEHYKRVPAGYDATHPNAALLKYTGLWAGRTTSIPEVFFSARFVDHCLEAFEPLLPLNRWLAALGARKI
jgi:uncharacterized protein (TIGR02453 family)